MMGTGKVRDAGQISELYVLEYLLQNTVAAGSPLSWRPREPGGFVTSHGGVEVRLDRERTVAGSRIVVALWSDGDLFYIAEPWHLAFGSRSRSDDEGRLGQLIRKLEAAVAGQCARHSEPPPEDDSRKLRLFRQLLFGEQHTEK